MREILQIIKDLKKKNFNKLLQKSSFTCLGGHYVESDAWDPSVTHVITEVDNMKKDMAEKVMAAIPARGGF